MTTTSPAPIRVVPTRARFGRAFRWVWFTVALATLPILFARLFMEAKTGLLTPALEHGELAVLAGGVSCGVADMAFDVEWRAWQRFTLGVCFALGGLSTLLLVAALTETDLITTDTVIFLSAGTLAVAGLLGGLTAALTVREV